MRQAQNMLETLEDVWLQDDLLVSKNGRRASNTLDKCALGCPDQFVTLSFGDVIGGLHVVGGCRESTRRRCLTQPLPPRLQFVAVHVPRYKTFS